MSVTCHLARPRWGNQLTTDELEAAHCAGLEPQCCHAAAAIIVCNVQGRTHACPSLRLATSPLLLLLLFHRACCQVSLSSTVAHENMVQLLDVFAEGTELVIVVRKQLQPQSQS